MKLLKWIFGSRIPEFNKTAVRWRFSGVRIMDGMTVYGEYPFTYEQGVECYNMSTFWRHVQNGYIDPETVSLNAT